MAVHNHGPDDPANPFCGESMVGGKLTGECLKSESQASVRAVLTEALSEALKRLWTDPEDAADQAAWDALPGKLADAVASLPGVAVIQLPEPDDDHGDGIAFWTAQEVGVADGMVVARFDPGNEVIYYEPSEAWKVASALAAAAVVATGEEACQHRSTQIIGPESSDGRGEWYQECTQCGYVTATGIDL